VEAARWRWPWWYVAGTAALMFAVSVALDLYDDPALLAVVYCCGVALLQVPLAGSMRVRLHRSRLTLRATWPLAALLVAVAAVYVLARLALAAVSAPLPSTISGVLMASAYVLLLPAAQAATAQRLQPER